MASTRFEESSRQIDSDGHIVIYTAIENEEGENELSASDQGERNDVGEVHPIPEGEDLPCTSPLVEGSEPSNVVVQSLAIVHRSDEETGEEEVGGSGRPEHGSSVFGGAKSAWESFRSRFFSASGKNADSVGEGNEGEVDIEQGSGSSRERGGVVEASPGAVCLICLDPLSQEDFVSGKAISLECGCRGDLALRHKECAVKWSQVKDDGRGGLPICELCKKPVQNLPELPARPQEQVEENVGMTIEEAYLSDPSQFQQLAPSRADIVFDCIRVTWIAMIISILFFNASIEIALWTGLVAGAAYVFMLRLLYKQHFEAMRAYAEQHAVVTGQRVHQLEVHNV